MREIEFYGELFRIWKSAHGWSAVLGRLGMIDGSGSSAKYKKKSKEGWIFFDPSSIKGVIISKLPFDIWPRQKMDPISLDIRDQLFS